MVAHVLSVRYNHYNQPTPPPITKFLLPSPSGCFFVLVPPSPLMPPFQSVFVNLGEDGKIKTKRQRGEREMFHQFNAYLL